MVSDKRWSLITKPLLAVALEDIDSCKFPVWVTPKIDGIRALRLGTMVSRTFKDIPNVRMRTVLSELLPEGSDGEIICGDTFQETTSAVMRSTGSANFDKPFTFYWFDYVKDDPKKGYLQRIDEMKAHVTSRPEILQHPQAKIVCLFPEKMENKEQLEEYEKKALAQGHEGVMLRSSDGKYKMGRSTLREGILLKLKRFSDDEAVIVGTEELMHNTNEKTLDNLGHAKRSHKKEHLVPAQTLGALVVERNDGVVFNIGTGFDECTRDTLWKEKDTLIGKTVKYKHFEKGSKDAPRHPVFLGFRDPIDMDNKMVMNIHV